jgi:hypothetical protein
MAVDFLFLNTFSLEFTKLTLHLFNYTKHLLSYFGKWLWNFVFWIGNAAVRAFVHPDAPWWATTLAQLYPPIYSGVSPKQNPPIVHPYPLVHSFLLQAPSLPAPHLRMTLPLQGRSRMLSLPSSLPSMKRVLRRLFRMAGPFPRCSFPRGTRPLLALLHVPTPRHHSPRLWQKGRPVLALGEAYACTCTCAPSTSQRRQEGRPAPPQFPTR